MEWALRPLQSCVFSLNSPGFSRILSLSSLEDGRRWKVAEAYLMPRLSSVVLSAEWRNGRRWGLKIPCPLGRVGSTPTSAIAEDRGQEIEDRKTVIKSVKDLKVFRWLTGLLWRYLRSSKNCMYISKDEHKRLDNSYDEVNAMLYSLMNNWKSFSDF